MNRRFLLRFLGLAPLGGVAAIVTAGTAPAATTWGAGIPGHLWAWKPPQPFTPAMHAEFQRQFSRLLSAIAYCSALSGATGPLPRQLFAAANERAPAGYPYMLAARMLEIHALRVLADDADTRLQAVFLEYEDLRGWPPADDWQVQPRYLEYLEKAEPIRQEKVHIFDRIETLERLPLDAHEGEWGKF